MEDQVSRTSVDSLSVAEEFVVVTPTDDKTPRSSSSQGSNGGETGLKITGNGNMDDLKQHLDEVLSDDNADLSDQSPSSPDHPLKQHPLKPTPEVSVTNPDVSVNSEGTVAYNMQVSTGSCESYELMPSLGERVLSGHVGSSQGQSPAEDEQPDPWVPRNNPYASGGQGTGGPTSIPPVDKVCTLFSRIIYLGAAMVNAPKSEAEATAKMGILKGQQSQNAIEIVLSVPRTSEGCCRLLEPDGKSEIAQYRITRILFCCRGREGTPISDCFAFTCSQGTRETQIFQCHIFRCEVQEAVQKILKCFGQAFHRVPKSPGLVDSISGALPAQRETVLNYTIPVLVDIKEDDGKGNYNPVPRDKRCFKLRQGCKKEVLVTVNQQHHRILIIERCFGLLICPGREVPDREMHLLDVVNLEHSNDGKSYTVMSRWDPNQADLEVLNTESPPGLDKGMFMTIAVDLVIAGIQEPVRFVVETKVRIFPSSERFWYYMHNKKPVQELFYLVLEEAETSVENESAYKVLSLESEMQRERQRNTAAIRQAIDASVQMQIQTPDSMNSMLEEESEDDEPLQSGSGIVDKDCDENILLNWGDLLAKWRRELSVRPKQLKHMVRKGVPEALRGEVWQLLAGVHDNKGLMEDYRVLITKNSPMENVIVADISRTFTAHDKFKSESEGGQDAMYKISKAYSVYDEEVSYCQGLSFLAAVLWLHMPEEQAFAVLVKIMYEYQLREMFMNKFIELHVKFYQLQRLIEDNLPDLHSHFTHIGVECHMFASQWFLTLYTAKFPLHTVFHIMDVFLSEGMPVVFNIALALLKAAKKELLGQDFEGVLKYFRVNLPKRYRTEESAQELMQSAMSTKVSLRKLKKYRLEFQAIKEEEDREDPADKLERENKQFLQVNMRLEQENDELARELITHRLSMEKQLDRERDRADELEKELKASRLQVIDLEEGNRHLESETSQVKELYRRDMEKNESDSSRNTAIIADYKQICSQLSERLEKQQTANRQEMERLRIKVQDCDTCSKFFTEDGKLIINPLDPDELNERVEPDLAAAQSLIRELELQLAQTKLQLVESECKVQDLAHQLNSAVGEIQSSRNNSWLTKTFTTLKEATTQKTGLKEPSTQKKE